MRKAGDIISALFNERFGPEFMETARSSAGLFGSWEQLVAEVWPGKKNTEFAEDAIPAAAVHSRIRELEHEVLVVEADHPGWIQILQTRQAELLKTVRRKYPELNIRAIAFRLSRDVFGTPATENPVNKSGAEPPVKEDAVARHYNESTERPESRPRDEEFYEAMKKLKENIKIRNGL